MVTPRAVMAAMVATTRAATRPTNTRRGVQNAKCGGVDVGCGSVCGPRSLSEGLPALATPPPQRPCVLLGTGCRS